MTACDEMRERILEADLRVLQAGDSSDLAIHLQACDSCRAVAAQLVAAEGELRAALERLEPGGSAEQAAFRAMREARVRKRRRPLALTAIAMAAGLAALVLFRPDDHTVSTSPPALAETPPLVEAPAGQDVIVYHTANPNVVVLWLYQRKGI